VFASPRRAALGEEGNVCIYIFPEGWFWYIPLARQTSVGCVLHQRVVKRAPDRWRTRSRR
jgi:hypothetical protein